SRIALVRVIRYKKNITQYFPWMREKIDFSFL
ncbi:uncharacterized protein METZ01_LOCUS477063, partial [marine metagenome]